MDPFVFFISTVVVVLGVVVEVVVTFIIDNID